MFKEYLDKVKKAKDIEKAKSEVWELGDDQESVPRWS